MWLNDIEEKIDLFLFEKKKIERYFSHKSFRACIGKEKNMKSKNQGVKVLNPKIYK